MAHPPSLRSLPRPDLTRPPVFRRRNPRRRRCRRREDRRGHRLGRLEVVRRAPEGGGRSRGSSHPCRPWRCARKLTSHPSPSPSRQHMRDAAPSSLNSMKTGGSMLGNLEKKAGEMVGCGGMVKVARSATPSPAAVPLPATPWVRLPAPSLPLSTLRPSLRRPRPPHSTARSRSERTFLPVVPHVSDNELLLEPERTRRARRKGAGRPLWMPR
jgi:hypothetical protein